MTKYTPAMQQYIDIKKQHEDCILFFRLWDFYEVFFEDAKLLSKMLDLVLTSKNKNSENPIPMAGIPYHSADKYIPRIIQNGYKVAIAEQTTAPQPGKIVEREVVSVVTPGTFIKEWEKKFSYMVAVSFENIKTWANYNIAWGDFSMWEYNTKSFENIEIMQNFILGLDPVEIIFDVDFPNKTELQNNIKNYTDSLISIYDVPVDPDKYILNQCKIQTLSSFGQALEWWRLDAFALLLNYLKNTQKSNLHNIVRVSLHTMKDRVLLDNITIKNLEVFASSYENNEKYSLVWVLDNTRTTAGARLLRWLLMNPINNKSELEKRVNNIEYYLNDVSQTKDFHKTLWGILDLQKITTAILYKKLAPSSFVKLRGVLRVFFDSSVISTKWIQWTHGEISWSEKIDLSQKWQSRWHLEEGEISKNKNRFLPSQEWQLLFEIKRLWLDSSTANMIWELYTYLNRVLKEDEYVKDDINFISDGIDQEIDNLRKIAYNSDEMLMEYQQELVKKSNVTNVKLKYIINQWYFIEITNKDIELFESNLASVSGDWDGAKFDLVRRNTLKWAQRYTSKYLDEIQWKILEAKELLVNHEFKFLEEVKNTIATMISGLNDFANYIAWFDLYIAHAIFATENNLTKAVYKEDGNVNIENGRHLVIERYLEDNQQFIPNNLLMDVQNPSSFTEQLPLKKEDNIGNVAGEFNDNWFVHVVTGPNMGWKSTFLRQNALIVLMAHCGFFVPASKAEISLVDGIFARVWSGDIIAKNQSTFMTEMVEVANILNNATSKSFVIFDELGRWTSTYDWLALTKAILEYVVTEIKAKTLIATHYHELIRLEDQYKGIKNYSVSVYETDKDVVFMKKIVKWWASKSYGLDVAKLAGVPGVILERANENLENLQSDKVDSLSQLEWQEWENNELFKTSRFIEKKDPKFEKIEALLKSFDINNMTPLQALQLLEKVKGELK